MTKNDNQPRPELRGSKLDAADLRRGHDIARNANDEQVAEPLVEQEFDGDARIRARDDGRKRVLSANEFGAPRLAEGARVATFAGDEAAIAVAQALQGISR